MKYCCEGKVSGGAEHENAGHETSSEVANVCGGE